MIQYYDKYFIIVDLILRLIRCQHPTNNKGRDSRRRRNDDPKEAFIIEKQVISVQVIYFTTASRKDHSLKKKS